MLRRPEILADLDLRAGLKMSALAGAFDHYLPLALQVIDQTRRRVAQGESVPALEKIVSIFEEHTDIIRKDRRATLYGHKICLRPAKSFLNDPRLHRCCKAIPRTRRWAKKIRSIAKPTSSARPPRQVGALDGAFAPRSSTLGRHQGCWREGCVAFSKSVGPGNHRHGQEQPRSTSGCGTSGPGSKRNISFLKRIFGPRSLYSGSPGHRF